MIELWLESPQSNFHNLVDNTEVFYPLDLQKEEIIKYLKLINNFNKFYSNLCNYDLIDYERLIYIENTFKDDDDIIKIIEEIKQRISESYVYKHRYIKRITNSIPKEYFNQYHDEYLVNLLEIDPVKQFNRKEKIGKNNKEGN